MAAGRLALRAAGSSSGCATSHPGAGWGVLDHRGQPKAAYHHLRRALAPLAVWTTDEGLGGIDVHVANDRPEPARGRLRVALYQRPRAARRGGRRAARAARPRLGAPRTSRQLLGRFVDVSWAYRFGPAAQDVVVGSLEREGEEAELLSQSFRFPAGRPLVLEPAQRLGLSVAAAACSGELPAALSSAQQLSPGECACTCQRLRRR